MEKWKAVLYSLNDAESMAAEQLLKDASVPYDILGHSFDYHEPVLRIHGELLTGLKEIRPFLRALQQSKTQ